MPQLALVRVNKFRPEVLAPQLRAAVGDTQRTLKRRFLPGTVKRLGKGALGADANDYVHRLVQEDSGHVVSRNGRGTFAVVERPVELTAADMDRVGADVNDLSVVGLATIIGGLQLMRQVLPVPPAVNRRLPAVIRGREEFLGSANITGWTTGEHDNGLAHVYRQLISEARQGDIRNTWTIEPSRAGDQFHAALLNAGMERYGAEGHFDVGEVSTVIPRLSWEYIHIED